MSARMMFPLSQRRHTNIAVVRYNKNGVKLEIACYKNKVISYRAGTEDRLDEVLQVDRIFTNVGRGYIAPEKDIEKVFGKDMTEEEAIKYMLVHGEMQVGERERTVEVDEMFKDIAAIIAQKCVNSQTQRPFPSVVIEQALRSIGTGVKLDQPVKKQALGLIHQLIESQIIPIARADMKLRCTTTTAAALALVAEWCTEKDATVLERKENPEQNMFALLIVMQPHLFRDLEALVKQSLPEGSNLHMVEVAVMEIGEGDAADINMLTQAQTGSDRESSLPVVEAGTRARQATSHSSESAMPIATRVRAGRAGAQQLYTDDSSDDESRAEKSNKKGKKKKGGKHKGGRGDSDNDSDAAEVPPPRRGGEVAIPDELTQQLQHLGLDPLEDNMSSDDGITKGKGKRSKRKKGGGTVASRPQPKKEESEVSEVDSDEELMGNRRQRNKQSKKDTAAQGTYDEFDEDNYDYGDD